MAPGPIAIIGGTIFSKRLKIHLQENGAAVEVIRDEREADVSRFNSLIAELPPDPRGAMPPGVTLAQQLRCRPCDGPIVFVGWLRRDVMSRMWHIADSNVSGSSYIRQPESISMIARYAMRAASVPPSQLQHVIRRYCLTDELNRSIHDIVNALNNKKPNAAAWCRLERALRANGDASSIELFRQAREAESNGNDDDAMVQLTAIIPPLNAISTPQTSTFDGPDTPPAAGLDSVLLVDDEDVPGPFLDALERLGYRVTVCKTEREAATRIEANADAILLCDVHLGEDGGGWAAMLRLLMLARRTRSYRLRIAWSAGGIPPETIPEADIVHSGPFAKTELAVNELHSKIVRWATTIGGFDHESLEATR